MAGRRTRWDQTYVAFSDDLKSSQDSNIVIAWSQMTSSVFNSDTANGRTLRQSSMARTKIGSSALMRRTWTSTVLTVVLAFCYLVVMTTSTDSDRNVLSQTSEFSGTYLSSESSNGSAAETDVISADEGPDNSAQFLHTKKSTLNDDYSTEQKRRRRTLSTSSSSSSQTYYDFVMNNSCSDNDICGKVILNTTYKMDGNIDCTPVVVEQRNLQRRLLEHHRSQSERQNDGANRILDAIVVVDGPDAVLDCQGHSIRVKGDANVASTQFSMMRDHTATFDSSLLSKVSNVPLVKLINGATIQNCTLIQTAEASNPSTMTAIQLGSKGQDRDLAGVSLSTNSSSSCYCYKASHVTIRGPFSTGIDATVDVLPSRSPCHHIIDVHDVTLQQVVRQGISIAAVTQSDHEENTGLLSANISVHKVQIFVSKTEGVLPSGITLSLLERNQNQVSDLLQSIPSIDVRLEGVLVATTSPSESEESSTSSMESKKNVVSLDTPTSRWLTGGFDSDPQNSASDNLNLDDKLHTDQHLSQTFGAGVSVTGSGTHCRLSLINVTVLSMVDGLVVRSNSILGALSVVNSQFSNNDMDGIKVVGDVKNVELDNLLVAGNGNDGILVSSPSICHGSAMASIYSIVLSGNFGRGLYIGCLPSEQSSSQHDHIYLERLYACGNGNGGIVLDNSIHANTEFGPGIVGDECHVVDVTQESRKATIQGSCVQNTSPCRICSRRE